MTDRGSIDLTALAADAGISMVSQRQIADSAMIEVRNMYQNNPLIIKENFDAIVSEVEGIAYSKYLAAEQQYGRMVFRVFADSLQNRDEANDVESLIEAFGQYFSSFDKFFLSLSQSRRARAGRTFELTHNALFRMLGYPFVEQAVINGQPDFLMPSKEHYDQNPMDCIIFTAKRTLRERWRQIVTEGTRGLGFFLATIDDGISTNQLQEMLDHRIYLVVPDQIMKRRYSGVQNVLSFRQFFTDHLDPAMNRWRRNGVI